MSSIPETLGVRIDASNAFIQAAIYGFLLVGVAAFAAPIVSTILLSLFVLPGKSVRDCSNVLGSLNIY
jgi:17beta-estradiol 17-dehydrogenase / very-long-chain 3-oxoacyl-CoA reductase